MIDVFLLLIVLGLITLIGLIYYLNGIERSKLINAIIAKHATDMVNQTLADSSKIEVKPDKPVVNDELIPTDQLTQAQFEAMINEDNKTVDQTIA